MGTQVDNTTRLSADLILLWNRLRQLEEWEEYELCVRVALWIRELEEKNNIKYFTGSN
jgi:hypothetical protein